MTDHPRLEVPFDEVEKWEKIQGSCARLYAAAEWGYKQALATPPPEPPTDEELLRTYGEAKRDHCYEGDSDDWPKKAERAATVAGLRAVLERWGR